MKVKKLPSEFLQRGWNNSTIAADEQGVPCKSDDPKAVSFCLYGAMYAACLEDTLFTELRAALLSELNKACKDGDPIAIIFFNDNICKGQDEAVAVMQKAEAAIGLEKE